MKKDIKNSSEADSLRQKAEEHLQEQHSSKTLPQYANTKHPVLSFSKGDSSEFDRLKLLHELEVHQIELEMQNEELRLALNKAAVATALYDFAPVGYFTLNSNSMICELNFLGAKLLGQERSFLVHSNFRHFITRDTLHVFDDFFRRVFESYFKETCEVRLSNRKNSSNFVHLEGIMTENEQKCLITAIDISDQKRIEEDLKKRIRELEIALNQWKIQK